MNLRLEVQLAQVEMKCLRLPQPHRTPPSPACRVRATTKEGMSVNKAATEKKIAKSAQQSLHERMQALRMTLANDPVQAKEFLQRAGILTKSGKLTKAYK